MKGSSTVWSLFLLAKSVLGDLVGYGIWPYEPACAFACDLSLSSLKLSCSDLAGSGMDMDMDAGMTSPQCRASNRPWLMTLSWCISLKCAESEISTSELEAFWEEQSTGDSTVAPKWSYSTTLSSIAQPPSQELTETDDTLNFTALVNPFVYEEQYNALTAVQRENVVGSGYGITILVTGFGVPLVLTWLAHVPYVSGTLDKVKPYLVYPSIIGSYHVRPLPYLLGNAPTIGQGLYITIFFVLNLVLTAVNYDSKQPHAWFATQQQEITAYIFYRSGTLAFALAPLVLLFSSRNNILLWMTNWSHSTFLLLHRWVARIFALQVLLHSLLALPLYYPTEAREQYWIWGAVATVAVMILSVSSGLYVRLFAYEFFLISHIVLAVFLIVGCWYHVELWIGLTWGYETWLYAACAVWFFDRLARVGRILKTGLRKATVTDLGGGYIRVDVLGIRWGSEVGKHVYAFFPSIHPFRPWENHPFSIVPTALLQPSRRDLGPGCRGSTAGSDDVDVEKREELTSGVGIGPSHRSTAGITLFIKKSAGMTKYLQAHAGLLTLLDGPYQNNSTKNILRCDRLLLIGGGIGITSLLPWLTHHQNVKLCWSVKETARCLVEAMDSVLKEIHEKNVRVGRRLNLTELLTEEADSGWDRIGVVVSGPGGLCDDCQGGCRGGWKERENSV